VFPQQIIKSAYYKVELFVYELKYVIASIHTFFTIVGSNIKYEEENCRKSTKQYQM